MRRQGRHSFEYTVLSDERVEERRREMYQDHGKEQESQIKMRVPEQRMQVIALW